KACHEINAQNRSDDAEGISHRISDRRVFVAHHVKRCLQRCGAGHRTGENPKRMAYLDSKHLAEPERDHESGDDRNEAEKVIFATGGTRHAFEKLPAVLNSNAVEEHDQANQSDWTGDLRFRRKGTQRKPDEQHSAHAKRKAADADLADEVSETYCEKRSEDRLGADNIAGQFNHQNSFGIK